MDKREETPIFRGAVNLTIFQFGKCQSLSSVRRAFRKQSYPENHKDVLNLSAFKIIVDRFEKTGRTAPKPKPGRISRSDEDVNKVKTFFQDNEKYIREAIELSLSYGTVWNILRKDLRWKPYGFSKMV